MAKIRPVNRGDRRDTYGVVKTPLSMTSSLGDNSVESAEIFGDESFAGKNKENLSIYLRRGYIPLAIPVLNFFLTGSKAGVLSLILREDVEAIALGQKYYDLELGKEVSVENIQTSKLYGEHILMGGNYIRWLIDKLDVESEICRELVDYCVEAAKRATRGGIDRDKRNEILKSIDVSKTRGNVEVLPGFYMSAAPGMDTDIFLEQFNKELCSNLSNLKVITDAYEIIP